MSSGSSSKRQHNKKKKRHHRQGGYSSEGVAGELSSAMKDLRQQLSKDFKEIQESIDSMSQCITTRPWIASRVSQSQPSCDLNTWQSPRLRSG